ncbi:aldose epimerase family protein [Pseudoruegeria sp. SK021]|uniref:aldose epimerase family protein n=1 Tax=Pseudoruegeria sp. SK021 TaxID=1933035 RepID=UPI000A25B3EB|nr:aldose epimerase family protein [Pseudoruegeria sp. SK021]OSP56498.1 hypothetical protein BV911_00610 [Pseudoruegeria sp. SK021]
MSIPTQQGIDALDLNIDGQPVQKVTLHNGNMTVALLSLGAIVQDVRLAGVPYSVTLGTDQVAAYAAHLSACGSLIGPVVNRISNAKASLDGQVYQFEANGPNATLHSGSTGAHHRNWFLTECNAASAVFELSLADGDGGFPGNRVIAARFALIGPRTLELRVAATTDADTWINFANHSFWNLDGTDTFAGHTLQVDADRYCVADENALVTGEVLPVAGTPMDFREPKVLSPGTDPRIDTNFCLSETRQPIRPVLTLTGTSGISMTVHTTEPGIQVYDAGTYSSGDAPGHDGKPFGKYSGVAIEAQGWPDAPNQPSFPSVVLRAGHSYEQITRWSFQL